MEVQTKAMRAFPYPNPLAVFSRWILQCSRKLRSTKLLPVQQKLWVCKKKRGFLNSVHIYECLAQPANGRKDQKTIKKTQLRTSVFFKEKISHCDFLVKRPISNGFVHSGIQQQRHWRPNLPYKILADKLLTIGSTECSKTSTYAEQI